VACGGWQLGVRISCFFLSTPPTFSLLSLSFDSSSPHTPLLASEKKIHLLLLSIAQSSCCCVWSSCFSKKNFKRNSSHPPVALKSTHTHQNYTHAKTKTKSKEMSQKSEQPPKAEEATPTHAHKHIDYSVRFSFFPLARSRLSRAESLLFFFSNSKIALVFSFGTRLVRVFFLGALSLSLSRARAPVLCAGRWYK
jgi:hypothetical protein